MVLVFGVSLSQMFHLLLDCAMQNSLQSISSRKWTSRLGCISLGIQV